MRRLEEMTGSMIRRSTGEMQAEAVTSGGKDGRDGSTCPVCRNTGWAVELRNGMEFARECGCGFRRSLIMHNKIDFAELPDAFRDVRLGNFCFSSYRTEKGRKCAIQSGRAIKYWLDNLPEMQERGMGLYLFSGTKGSGKTRMAASIANELIAAHGKRVKFTTSVNALNKITSTWGKSSWEEHEILSYLSDCEVLILDDFGTEAPKEWVMETFYHIINNRYVGKKVTIFTSNMDIDDLRYNGRITNRIKERVFRIPFPEESVREYIAEGNAEEILKAVNG